MAKPKIAKIKVAFTYQDPKATKVTIVGDFTGWEQAPLEMKKSKGGTWKKEISLVPGEYEYRLMVDGSWADDPQCQNRRPNQYGGQNCVCVVTAGNPEPAHA